MTSALDNIDFISRSPHRVEVLRALLEEPHDRSELRAATGASSSTLGRIMNDFTDQGWVTRESYKYEITPMGRLVGREFTQLLTTMEAVEELHEAAAWLPAEAMDFDLSALRGAEITESTESNPFMPILVMAGQLSAADHVQMLSNTVIPQTLAAIHDAVVNCLQTFEAVVTQDLLDAISTDPTMTQHSQDLLESAHATTFRHDGDIPYNLVIADESVLIGVTDDQQMPRALIETDDEEVVSWAESTYQSYQSEATLLETTKLVA